VIREESVILNAIGRHGVPCRRAKPNARHSPSRGLSRTVWTYAAFAFGTLWS
jgi:hypothetical protein